MSTSSVQSEEKQVGHTPGPWTAFVNTVFWEVHGPGDFGHIGDTCASSASAPEYGRSMELGGANARLMAAAPDLLAACNGLLDAIHDSMTHASQKHHEAAIAAARAAIAKATGGAK